MYLPINKYEKEILESVKNNAVTIITAETGSGKSTQVPRILNELGGYEIVVTQPRRIAARTVAMRVAAQMRCQLGGKVGYKTGFEAEVSSETEVMFCTDGLQLVREVVGQSEKRNRVLIIDEVHEWNLNIETLIAWAKHKLDEGFDMKVVVMSATLETEKLSDFFDGANIIDVPGKLFDIEEKSTTGNIIVDVAELVDEGRNVLVFQPGKREIEQLIGDLNFLKGRAVLFPLHGEMEVEEQNKCFVKYSVPKVIVATNVAQTSITIPDIDAVVDSAVEKRVEVEDGIESLVLGNISKADSRQRRGRAGRVKEGIYVYASETDTPYKYLDEYSIPEISRLRLDQIVLRLASIEIDAEDIDFFHQPEKESIRDSKKLLKALGALDEEGNITEIGKMMALLPTSVRCSRMLVEAKELNVLSDMIDIVSVFEAGGINGKNPLSVNSSAFIAQKRLFDKMNEKIKNIKESGRDIKNLSKEEKERLYEGVNKKSYYRALEIRRKLKKSIYKAFCEKEITSTGNTEDISIACIVGLKDKIFKGWGTEFIDIKTCDWYRVDNKASFSTSSDFISGIERKINFKNKFGVECSMTLITWPVSITDNMLKRIFPYREEHTYDVFLERVEKNEYIKIGLEEEKINTTTYEPEEVSDEIYIEALANCFTGMITGGINSYSSCLAANRNFPDLMKMISHNSHYSRTTKDWKDFFTKKMTEFEVTDIADVDEFYEQFMV